MTADRLARIETALFILIKRELSDPVGPNSVRDRKLLEIIASEMSLAKERGELNFVVHGGEGSSS